MTRIIADISVSPDGLATGPGPSPDNGLRAGGEAHLVQRSVISTSAATHLTCDVSR